MNDTIPHILDKVSAMELILSFVLIIAIIYIIYINWTKISVQLYKTFKKKDEENKMKKNLQELQKENDWLKDKMTTYEKNRELDRNTSIQIRDKLDENIQQISMSVKDLTNTVTLLSENVSTMHKSIQQMQIEMEENRKKNLASKRIDIKSKIERLYSECSPTQSCTDMQFETLKELIEDYENHGGENSFVHSIVQKEMYKWKRKNNYRE